MTRIPDQATAVRRAASLAEAFDPRSNSMDVLRLLLATTVAVAHTTLIGFGHQPRAGSSDLGSLAVDAFFVLSGFLVTRSYLRLNSLPRYLWHRGLRILPAFWSSLLLTAFAIAPLLAWLQDRQVASIFSGPDSAWGYVANNALLLMRQFGIAGLPGVGTEDDVLNGSLWTLFYEACCYGIVALLGITGILLRRRWLVLAGLVAAWALTIAAAAGVNPLGSEFLLRLGFVFMLGSAGFLFADRIPMRGRAAAFVLAASLVLLVVGLAVLPDYRPLAAPAFAYLCLWAVVRLPLRRHLSWDLSYGMYIWHWPIAQVLLCLGLTALTTVPFVLIGLLVTAAVAAVSWACLERPALALKDAAWVGRVRLPRRRRAGR